MIYHFLGASPYTERFIGLLRDAGPWFDRREHCFVVNACGEFAPPEGLTDGLNCCVDPKPWGFASSARRVQGADRAIIHGLFNPRLILYMQLHPGFTRRCIWSMWGGDVYYRRLIGNRASLRMVEVLRRAVIPRMPLITGLVRGDYVEVQRVYGTDAPYLESFYQSPVDLRGCSAEQDRGKASRIVLLGNSGDPLNRHEEAMELLTRIDDGLMRVLCPLSYGDARHAKSVIQTGERLFGGRFEAITGFLSSDEYTRALADVDVGIMNHAWQQAIGTTVLLLALGKKVYVRSESSVFEFFRERGVRLHPISELEDSPSLFSSDLDEARANRSNVLSTFSDERFYDLWRQVFQFGIG